MNKLIIKKIKLIWGCKAAGFIFYNNKFVQKLFGGVSLILEIQFEDILDYLIFFFIILVVSYSFFLYLNFFFPEIRIILDNYILNFIETNFYVTNIYLKSISHDVIDEFNSVTTFKFISVRRRLSVMEIIFWRIFGMRRFDPHISDQYQLYLNCLNEEIKREPLRNKCNKGHENE